MEVPSGDSSRNEVALGGRASISSATGHLLGYGIRARARAAFYRHPTGNHIGQPELLITTSWETEEVQYARNYPVAPWSTARSHHFALSF
jgi:hypothetical protein